MSSKSQDALAGAANDPGMVVPGADQLTPLLRDALDKQRPELRQGVFDVLDRKRAEGTNWK